jgi:archaellum component FlaF (FlaF/FlaG flagellin family)
MMTNLKNNHKEQLKPLQNAHPGLDLDRTYGRLKDLNSKANGMSSFSRNELIDKLGFSVASGAANTVISALVHFGLLKKTESDYVYSELAIGLLNVSVETDTYYALLKDAALTPEMYKWLYDEYADKLPDDIADRLSRKYKHRNVDVRNVQKIINNYKKTLNFAKLDVTSNKKEASNSADTERDSYVDVNFLGRMVSIKKRYLVDAIRLTRADEMQEINETLKLR